MTTDEVVKKIAAIANLCKSHAEAGCICDFWDEVAEDLFSLAKEVDDG